MSFLGLRRGPKVAPGALDAPVLLHIGIPKSATTALQSSLAAARDDLARHGILYPDLDGRINHHQLATQLLGRKHAAWNPSGDSTAQLDQLRELAAAEGIERVVLSSELLAEVDHAEAKRVIQQLGKHVEVLVTLRSLPQLLPSSWQQGASAGHQVPFEQWLEEVLRDPERLDLRPLMSMRGDDGHTLISRWASLVGARRVTLLIPDPEDRSSVFHQAEQLLSLPESFLPTYSSNTSLTFSQSEFARLTGQAARRGLSSFERVQLIQQGLGNGMKKGAGDGGARTALPDWALDRAQAAARRLADAARSAKVTVVGDLADLELAGKTSDTRYEQPTSLPLTVVTDGLEGLFSRARQAPFVIDDALRPVDRPRRIAPDLELAVGTFTVAPLCAAGSAGLGEALLASRRRLQKAGVRTAVATRTGAARRTRLEVLPPMPETATPVEPGEQARTWVPVEPATVTVRRAYQAHLLRGGRDSWESFTGAFDARTLLAERDWEAVTSQLRALGARGQVSVVRADGTAALVTLAGDLEAATGLPADALVRAVRTSPEAALLSAPQLALLRAFNERTWREQRGVHYVRLATHGMVPSLLATGLSDDTPLQLVGELADAAAGFDARVAEALSAAGVDLPPASPASSASSPDNVADVPMTDAVAAARGMVGIARVAARRARENEA
ncbi:hypothetical protein [Demequina gelatinilytica]|uniref:hypothetical protein n=1 Tax=Demequina gelatinilytica TaxID=1638980 RepID=UPI0007827A60|nr:hypothetical protein [Demequina gelatinilytica]